VVKSYIYNCQSSQTVCPAEEAIFGTKVSLYSGKVSRCKYVLFPLIISYFSFLEIIKHIACSWIFSYEMISFSSWMEVNYLFIRFLLIVFERLQKVEFIIEVGEAFEYSNTEQKIIIRFALIYTTSRKWVKKK
jgi:hypothetical protein